VFAEEAGQIRQQNVAGEEQGAANSVDNELSEEVPHLPAGCPGLSGLITVHDPSAEAVAGSAASAGCCAAQQPS